MHRRTFLSAAAATAGLGVGAVTAQSGSAPGVAVELLAHGGCQSPPEVTVCDDTVTVFGCVVGPNACHGPSINGYECTDSRFIATVASVADTESDACASVVTHSGYSLVAAFDERVPETVRIEHNHYYGDGNGVVDTSGLRELIADWRNDAVGTELLRDGIDAWRASRPVSYDRSRSPS